jgi:hypothetical protein
MSKILVEKLVHAVFTDAPNANTVTIHRDRLRHLLLKDSFVAKLADDNEAALQKLATDARDARIAEEKLQKKKAAKLKAANDAKVAKMKAERLAEIKAANALIEAEKLKKQKAEADAKLKAGELAKTAAEIKK